MANRRALVAVALFAGVLAGIIGATHLSMDMSFRPTFTSDHRELNRTRDFQRTFGEVGFNELIALVDVGNAADPGRLQQVSTLSDRLRTLPHAIGVRDPLSIPYFDAQGRLHANGAGPALRSAGTRVQRQQIVTAVLQEPQARRLVIGDHNRRVAVAVAINLTNSDFTAWRPVDRDFRRIVSAWSTQTGYATQVTGYPDVEQVYAHEVLISVLRSIALLLVVMVLILYVAFRRLKDIVTCLAGVTLSVPVVLGAMTLMGQPFSIVNSQVLTLVLIVGIAEALHHQQEYRRRREAGRDHLTANREAFTILAWPAFMTGLATVAGFAALLTAKMDAIRSFGMATAVGVALVYLVNWATVPLLIHVFNRRTPAEDFQAARGTGSPRALQRTAHLVQRRTGAVVLGFALATVGLALAGAFRLSIDQKVNQELPSHHPARVAQSTYEQQFTGFLGPELQIRPRTGNVLGLGPELAAFVGRLCAMPEVRYVASPLDLLPQPPTVTAGGACTRRAGDLSVALAARRGAAGPQVQRLAEPLLSADGQQASLIVRVPDIGTGKSIPFVHRVLAAARDTMPSAEVAPVGQWWLAQQGMHSLSFEMAASAVTALALVLPIMWFAIRDRRLFLAGLLPTLLPVFATLGFMGLMHITVRIGTGMILAIALGLSADDTIHLSIRIRDRVRAGNDPASAVSATLLRSGRPAALSSLVLIGGFASMTFSSLVALREMGLIAAFTMSFALATDIILGPALYLMLARGRRAVHHVPRIDPAPLVRTEPIRSTS
jgi:predicted RND superfamily exporter protein